LRPKKAKEFIDDVAKEVGLAKEVVESVIGFYYRELRQNLSNICHYRVHVTNLGDFTIKHWKVDDKIDNVKSRKKHNKDMEEQGSDS